MKWMMKAKKIMKLIYLMRLIIKIKKKIFNNKIFKITSFIESKKYPKFKHSL